MSSDEDFSMVTPQPPEDTLEGITASINNYKKKYEQLMEEQMELAKCRDDRRELTQQFRKRTHKLTQSLKEDQKTNKDKIEEEKARLKAMQQEEIQLMEELQRVEAELREAEATNVHLREQTEVFTAVPEKTVVFKGSTGEANTQVFDMKSHVVYPMDGGTALITFEEEDVAKNILTRKTHQVNLGEECRITVEARPVHLMVPKLVEIDTQVCHQRILISNLPKMNPETLLNKLEIHFSKSRHGGGEVEECELLPDSGTVVLTFVKDNIARGLTDAEFHEVELQKKKHKLRVTPFLKGTITNLETKMAACPRTVLLAGIPDVMERENLQDLLEIHFQKSSNGGGEIEAFLYNPLGQNISAVFDDAAAGEEEE